jgi:fibronectin type 3 domain-containing protein
VPAAGEPGYAVDWTGTGTAYRVYRSGDLSGPYTLVSTQTSTSYTDPSFAMKATRYFKVVAVNAVGLSVDSNVLEVSRNGNSDNFRCGAP